MLAVILLELAKFYRCPESEINFPRIQQWLRYAQQQVEQDGGLVRDS